MKTRIGVAFAGDSTDPTAFSGIPYGITQGLIAAGAEPVPIRASALGVAPSLVSALMAAVSLRPERSLGAAINKARWGARTSSQLAYLNARDIARNIAAAGEIDGVIQIATLGHPIPVDVPIVTFEDMTGALWKDSPYVGWGHLSERAVSRRLELQRELYDQAVGCCAMSQWVADSLIQDYQVPPEKVHVVGIGRNHVVRPSARDWSPPRFLFVGMDWQRKNGDAVLRAFSRLRTEHPGAQLDLVGVHPEVDESGVVGHGILRLNVSAERDRVEELFATATCFVMPSRCEAAGIAFVEAAGAGVPSIGTTVGGADYLIGDGGVVVNPDDEDALLRAMRRLAEPHIAEQMGAEAARRSEFFTWEAVARRLLLALGGAAVSDPVGSR